MLQKSHNVLPGQPQDADLMRDKCCSFSIADEDDGYFCRSQQEVCARLGCHSHAFDFTAKRIQRLRIPGSETGFTSSMRSVGRRYVQYFNTTYKRSAALCAGRYKTTMNDSENERIIGFSYSELNPERTIKLSLPGKCRWSGYDAYTVGKHHIRVLLSCRYQSPNKNTSTQQAALLFAKNIQRQMAQPAFFL